MFRPFPLGVLVPALVVTVLAVGADPAVARVRCPGAGAAVHARRTAQAQGRTLCLLNAVRRRHHLPTLRPERHLRQAAVARARALVRRHLFVHGDWMRRLRAYVAGAHRWWIGENIAYGVGPVSAPRRVMAMWMASPSHRRNILSRSFRDVGIGVAARTPAGLPGATYTTDFGGRW